MLHELDALEVRSIAEHAAKLRKSRDRLLEKIPEAKFGEPPPARGAHNPLGDLPLDEVLGGAPEFIALRDAIAALPRGIREKLWAVAETGRGRFAILNWEAALAEAAALSDAIIAARLLEDPDLHEVLRKGLYELGAASLPGGAA
jgi:hypothetical protein